MGGTSDTSLKLYQNELLSATGLTAARVRQVKPEKSRTKKCRMRERDGPPDEASMG